MKHLLPVAADGWRFIVPLFILGAVLLAVLPGWGKLIGVLGLVLCLFCVYFFRDFDRQTPLNDKVIFSPADGKIMEVAADPGEKEGTLIRIFLSVFNVHVQRAPVSGSIKKIDYKKGLFLDARDPEAHFRNEQNEMTIGTSHGDVVVTQIAGLIARRIVCWMRSGDALNQGARYGLIRFGSQVDVRLPKGAKILVKEGERVVGGLTVLAEWRD